MAFTYNFRRFPGQPLFPATPNLGLQLLSKVDITRTSALAAASSLTLTALAVITDPATQIQTPVPLATDPATVATTGICYLPVVPHNRLHLSFFCNGVANDVAAANVWVGKVFDDSGFVLFRLAASLALTVGNRVGVSATGSPVDGSHGWAAIVATDYTASSGKLLYNSTDDASVYELDGRGADFYRVDLSRTGSGAGYPSAVNGVYTFI